MRRRARTEEGRRAFGHAWRGPPIAAALIATSLSLSGQPLSGIVPPSPRGDVGPPAGVPVSTGVPRSVELRWTAASLVHDIPSDVTLVAFIVPEAGRLTFLVRVPLEAMRDFEFPLVGPGYLDIEAAAPLLEDAARLWIADYVTFFEDGRALPRPEPVAVRIAIPSDRSFVDYEDALARVRSPPLPRGTALPWEQALLDIRFEIPIANPEARFAVDPRFGHLGLRTTTVLKFKPPGRAERAFQYAGDPGLVRLDPRWHQAALRFVRLGFDHILDGLDHLLFLLCLVIPFRRPRTLLPVLTAFTVAHSITLIASAAGVAPRVGWFPPLIETLIALSIVFMAFENIVGPRLERRWVIAFAFGLVHGFGFSFALSESLQFAGSHLVTSLLAFNVGVEIGQLFVVLLAVPVIELLFRRVVRERIGTILLSALVAHTGWHWMIDRGAGLLAYDIRWPPVDLALLAAGMRWLSLILVTVAAAWLLSRVFGRFLRQPVARQRGGE